MTLHTLLNGDRLPLSGQYTLELLKPSDMPAICSMLADEQVNRHLFFAPASEQLYYDYFLPQFQAMDDAIEQRQPSQGPLMVAIRDGANTFAGMAVLTPTEGQPGQFSIGYQLPAAHWGLGLATAVCRLLTRFAFIHLGAQKVQADLYDTHTASKRVLEKSGYGRSHKVYGHFEQGQVDQSWFAQTRAQFLRSRVIAAA
ncbi:GNAT family N-acetyltransferase [Ferrimonas gelatinilytica]|uniref:N-acetyltransferase domain-containing protein n=1 Tax=Ferrimonas gelatinilytica TaxID=1255257 RepID=A0ABP9RVF0_9GAMM